MIHKAGSSRGRQIKLNLKSVYWTVAEVDSRVEVQKISQFKKASKDMRHRLELTATF